MPRPLRILVVTPEFPYPPFMSGNRAILFELFKRLHTRCRFTLVSLATAEEEADQGPLPEWCEDIRLSQVSYPEFWQHKWSVTTDLLQGPFYTAPMAEHVRQAMSSSTYDVVHLHTFGMAPYGRLMGATPWLAYAIDGRLLGLAGGFRAAVSAGASSASAWVQALMRALYALRCSRRSAGVIYVGEADARADGWLFPPRNVHVIPLGVDTAYYKPRPTTADGCQLVLTGVMDFGPNVEAAVWFARDVMPLIRRRMPQATFTVVGMNPTPEVSALAKLPGVAVTGYVADVRPYLWNSRDFVCPLKRARGIQIKVLQAMAAGLPVVGTPVSFRGVTRRPPPPGGIAARTASEFADAVSGLVQSPERLSAMGRAGRQFVETQFSWDTAAEKYEQICSSVVAGESG